ncbi:MAG TPA: hypothetical protein VGJ59_07835 [Jatrophihabitantaceae bacterium]
MSIVARLALFLVAQLGCAIFAFVRATTLPQRAPVLIAGGILLLVTASLTAVGVVRAFRTQKRLRSSQ